MLPYSASPSFSQSGTRFPGPSAACAMRRCVTSWDTIPFIWLSNPFIRSTPSFPWACPWVTNPLELVRLMNGRASLICTGLLYITMLTFRVSEVSSSRPTLLKVFTEVSSTVSARVFTGPL